MAGDRKLVGAREPLITLQPRQAAAGRAGQPDAAAVQSADGSRHSGSVARYRSALPARPLRS